MIASFMRKKKESGGFEEGMLKLVRTLPKVLKYLPSDKAADARNFMNSLQYWLGGSSENLENFLLMISKAYVPELAEVDVGEVAEPVTFPDIGIWHPMALTMFEDAKEYLNWYDTRKDIKFKKPTRWLLASFSKDRTWSPVMPVTTTVWSWTWKRGAGCPGLCRRLGLLRARGSLLF